MSRYRKIEVRTWADERFRRLSPIQPSGQGLWFFLLTGPHTGPIPGLFRAGRAAIAEELDWDVEAFDKAFQEVIENGMAKADFKARLVWLPNALKHNKPESPNVVRSWRVELDLLPECDLKNEALSHIREILESIGPSYVQAFDEVLCGDYRKPSSKPSGKASTKPSPNQEQEQEQEQEVNPCAPTAACRPLASDAELLPAVATATPPAKAARADTALQIACRATWEAYSAAYALRYGAAPVRAARQSAQVKQIVQALGAEESPPVAAWFVDHPAQWYVTKGHDIGLLLADLTKLRTEWATGRVVTTTAARQSDRRGAMASAVQNLLAECGGSAK